MLGEKTACAAVSPRMYLLSCIQVQYYPPLRQLTFFVLVYNVVMMCV